jgi:predicted MFS family arabinose efflux permease
VALPALPALPGDRATPPAQRLRAALAIIRSRAITPVCAVTTVLVIGQFAAYTYIAPLVRRDGGLHGLGLSAVLLGYGAVGLIANLLVGRLVDRRPGPALFGSIALVSAALVVLTFTGGAALTVVAVLMWGAGFTAVPVSLQSAILRVAPHAQDAASAVYVVAFQIGIGGGALVGEQFVRGGHLGTVPVLAAVLALGAGVITLVARRAFPHQPA